MNTQPNLSLQDRTGPEDAVVGWTLGRRRWIALGAILFVVLCAYLVRTHYAKPYSDPVGFVGMAKNWGSGGITTDRAPIYPIILHYLMRLTGRDWVFISNLPFVLIMVFLTGAVGWLTLRRESIHPAHIARLAGLAAVAVLVHARRGLLVELLNPFREPLAFSLLLIAVLAVAGGWTRRAAPWWMGLGGLCLGLAVSIRETVILMAVPFGIWVLTRMVAERRLHTIRIAMALAGLLAGLFPLIQQNRAHSGSAIVPSYAADKVDSIAQRDSWDIPIPGMSLTYFSTVGRTTLRKLHQAYAPAGTLLLVLGLIRAIRRRNDLILGFHAPAFFLNLFFYCFYRYHKDRYTLAAELFAIPIIVYGLIGVIEAVDRLARSRSPHMAGIWRTAVPVVLAIRLISVLTPPIVRGDNRTKVWHLAEIRRQILPHLDLPATFLGGRHFSFYFTWLLEQSSYEYTSDFSRIPFDPLTRIPVDVRLRSFGVRTVGRFASGNYYIDDPRFALGRNWLRVDPVFSLDSLTVPLERYGRPMRGDLYRVGLWTDTNLTLTVTRTVPGPARLMLDMKRIWDYPGRTFATLRAGAAGAAIPLTNAVQFVDLPAAAEPGPVAIQIESDRPLPPEPFIQLVEPNDPIRLAFGLGGANWAWNFASDSLYPNRAFSHDACQLYDEGAVRLPMYATPDREVYAAIRFEFIQEHDYWRRQPHRLTVKTAADSKSIRLPIRRRQETVIAGLGRGTGAFDTIPATLLTTLPSHLAQNTFPFWNECNKNGFVKIYDIEIFSLPPIQPLPAVVDVGTAGDAIHVQDGFGAAERSGAYRARWTEAIGWLRIRLPRVEKGIVVRWHALPVRPDQTTVKPALFVNEIPIPDAQVTVDASGPVWVYQAEVDSASLQADDWNWFSVEVPTWSPSRELKKTSDTRELGLLVERVEFIERK